MAISDHDRKILWTKAGNRCSLCRRVLVRDAGGSALAIVGEECHIISPKRKGPRGEADTEPRDNPDAYENLLLLCPSDHTLIDQAPDQYSPERLRTIRAAHEAWVHSRLEQSNVPTVTLKRGDPVVLVEIPDAETLVRVAMGAEEWSLDHAELNSEAEVEQIGGLLQLIFDYGEIWDDLEPHARVSAQYQLNSLLREARNNRWRVFGARGQGILRGGGEASSWETAYVRVVRSNSPEIMTVGLDSAPPPES